MSLHRVSTLKTYFDKFMVGATLTVRSLDHVTVGKSSQTYAPRHDNPPNAPFIQGCMIIFWLYGSRFVGIYRSNTIHLIPRLKLPKYTIHILKPIIRARVEGWNPSEMILASLLDHKPSKRACLPPLHIDMPSTLKSH